MVISSARKIELLSFRLWRLNCSCVPQAEHQQPPWKSVRLARHSRAADAPATTPSPHLTALQHSPLCNTWSQPKAQDEGKYRCHADVRHPPVQVLEQKGMRFSSDFGDLKFALTVTFPFAISLQLRPTAIHGCLQLIYLTVLLQRN